MKYIKKFFEGTNGEVLEDLRQCFENISDLPGFRIEQGAFDFSIELSNIYGEFKYDFNLLEEIEESLDRTKDLNLEFNRSWIKPYSAETLCQYSHSLVSSKESAYSIDCEYCWLGEEFPEPEELFFVKYPIFRKLYTDKKTNESLITTGSSTRLRNRMSIEYPPSKEDFLYSTSLESISFLLFKSR